MRTSPGEWMSLRRDRAMADVSALLYGASGVLLVISALMWSPGKNPRWVLASLSIIAFVFCWHALWRAAAFTRAECFALLVVLLGVVGVLTWTTPSGMTAYSNGAVLPLVAVYAAWFLTRRQTRIACYGGAGWWLVAILQRDDTLLSGLSLSIVVQTVAVVEVFSRIRARLETMARTDALTGALNRWGVQDVVAMQAAGASRRPFSVVLVDIDDLRLVNTVGGHRAGDELLADVVRHWRAHLRPGDSVGRLGGDEFLIVLPRLDEDGARQVVARLAAQSPGPWSAGVAAWQDGDDIGSLVERADQRMYAAKERRVG